MLDDLKRAAKARRYRPTRAADDAPAEPGSDHSPQPASTNHRNNARNSKDSVLIQALKRATADGPQHAKSGRAAPADRTTPETEKSAMREASRRTDEARRATEADRSRLDAEQAASQLAAERLQAERLAEAALQESIASEAQALAAAQARAQQERQAETAAQKRLAAEAQALASTQSREAAERDAAAQSKTLKEAERQAAKLAEERIAAETRLAEQTQAKTTAARAPQEQSQARVRLEQEALHAAQLRIEAEASLQAEEKARAESALKAQEAAQARITIETALQKEADARIVAELAAERAAQAAAGAHEQAIAAARERERAEEKTRKAALARAQADSVAEQKARELAESEAALRKQSAARIQAEQVAAEQAKRRGLAEQRAADEAVAQHRAEKQEAAQRATVKASRSRATIQPSWPLATAGATLALILGIAIGTSERAQPPAATPASRAVRNPPTPVMPEKLQLRLDDDVERFGSRPVKTGVESHSQFLRRAESQPKGSNNTGNQSMTNDVAPPARPDSFFKTLSRPDKPNNWLIAPRDFPLAADGPSPVFDVPVQILIDAFRSAALANGRAKVVEYTEYSMHIVDTTSLMGYQDDVHIQFIPVSERQSTLSAYSASRTGYWDIGTNRRRLEKCLRETQSRLSAQK